jgi:hypothetical protein
LSFFIAGLHKIFYTINIVYELNMRNIKEDRDTCLYFNSAAELLNSCVIEGKTLKEIWEDLEN